MNKEANRTILHPPLRFSLNQQARSNEPYAIKTKKQIETKKQSKTKKQIETKKQIVPFYIHPLDSASVLNKQVILRPTKGKKEKTFNYTQSVSVCSVCLFC